MAGNKSLFQEVIDRPVPICGEHCTVTRALLMLSPEDRAAAERALADPKITNTRIVEAFRALLDGYSPGRTSLRSHRRGEHVKCRPLTTP